MNYSSVKVISTILVVVGWLQVICGICGIAAWFWFLGNPNMSPLAGMWWWIPMLLSLVVSAIFSGLFFILLGEVSEVVVEIAKNTRYLFTVAGEMRELRETITAPYNGPHA